MYDVKNYAFPSIVLDRSGKIIAKNKAASVSCPFFRKGCGIKKQITAMELGAMFLMKSGESIVVTLKSGVSAIIFFDGESYLLRTNVLGVNVLKDISYIFDISENGLKYFEVPSMISNQSLVRHSFFVQKCMNEYIKFIMDSASVPHRIVNISMILQNIVKACNEKFKGTRLSVSAENISPSCCIVSSNSHTEYTIMMALSLLFYLSSNTHVIVNMFSSYGRACLSLKTYTNEKSKNLTYTLNTINGGKVCGEKNDMTFYALYIKAITELHGANVNMEYTPVSGEINIRISYPIINDDTLMFECCDKTREIYSELIEKIFYSFNDEYGFRGVR